MRRLLLALLVLGAFTLGFRAFVDRSTASRGSAPRAVEHVPAAPAVAEDERAPRAAERVPETGPEVVPAPAPEGDGFPRALLAGHVLYRNGSPVPGVALEVRARDQRGSSRPLA